MARRHEGRKTDYSWSDALLASEATALSATITLGDTSTPIINLAQRTIYRIRGEVTVVMDPGAAQDSMCFGIGLILVAAEAAVAGAASVPSPISALNHPWMWIGLFPLISGDASAQNGADINQAARREIDVKVMRKFRPGDTLLFVADGVLTGGSPTCTYNACARVLTGR